MSATDESGQPATAASASPAVTRTLCANCGAELLGPNCYECGQPVKGMIRPLTSMLHDVADTILNIDSRIFRTLLPLYFRPGFLSNEYFAGRRVRYVTPFRLYFFLSVAAFLLIQIGLDSTLDLSKDLLHFDGTQKEIAAAQTAQEAESRRDALLAELDKTRLAVGTSTATIHGLDKAAASIRSQTDKRLQYLAQVDDAKAKGKPAPADPDADDDKENVNLEIDGHIWDPQKNPISIGWLPAFANTKLNSLAGRMKENLPRIKKDPKPFLLGGFSTLPQVLFVLMPLFALLLKIFYIFKRRLYMEHLIVALHSHSFIFLSLLFLTLAGLVRSWAQTAAPWLHALLGWLMFAMGWWLPIYLFLMQKKVYKQGWFFTTLKYGMIGICYTVMISLGIAVAFVVSLATT
jgi:hypothetical protein